MSNPELESQVAAAKAYQALFVPALFEQWAPKVVDSAEITVGQKVLDVACGTGVLAREAQRRVASGGVSGLDRNAGMLAVARELTPSIDWRQGSAESMPFGDASFDAVVSQFGLMFMNQTQAIGEMLRVLKPGGHLAIAVWDSVENMPAFAAEAALLERIVGQRAADAIRAPFVLGDEQSLAATFAQAGMRSSITTHTGVAKFSSMRVLIEADVRGWLPVVGINLSEPVIGKILKEAEAVFSSYVGNDGRMEFEIRAHIVASTKA